MLCFALAAAGCISAEDAWSFRFSREIYTDVGKSGSGGGVDRNREYLGERTEFGSDAGAVVLIFVAIPAIIDVVILPVTGAHDLLVPVVRLAGLDGDEAPPLRPAPPSPR